MEATEIVTLYLVFRQIASAGAAIRRLLDAESIVTPGIFVDRVVGIANPAHESELVKAGASYP